MDSDEWMMNEENALTEFFQMMMTKCIAVEKNN